VAAETIIGQVEVEVQATAAALVVMVVQVAEVAVHQVV
jgi:hypothetical protein